jgi:hypothetical protein
MKTLQNRTNVASFLRLEADLEATINALFNEFPSLHGFAVGNGASLIEVGDDAWFGAPGEVQEAIAETLGDFLDERPEAEELLRGRTFARALH